MTQLKVALSKFIEKEVQEKDQTRPCQLSAKKLILMIDRVLKIRKVHTDLNIAK